MQPADVCRRTHQRGKRDRTVISPDFSQAASNTRQNKRMKAGGCLTPDGPFQSQNMCSMKQYDAAASWRPSTAALTFKLCAQHQAKPTVNKLEQRFPFTGVSDVLVNVWGFCWLTRRWKRKGQTQQKVLFAALSFFGFILQKPLIHPANWAEDIISC